MEGGMTIVFLTLPRVLKCAETGEVISSNETFFVGVGNGLEISNEIIIYALSASVISRIPQEERSPKHCSFDTLGIDISQGRAEWTAQNKYDFDSFDMGKFLFSLSKESAKKHLPNTYKKIYGV